MDYRLLYSYNHTIWPTCTHYTRLSPLAAKPCLTYSPASSPPLTACIQYIQHRSQSTTSLAWQTIAWLCNRQKPFGDYRHVLVPIKSHQTFFLRIAQSDMLHMRLQYNRQLYICICVYGRALLNSKPLHISVNIGLYVYWVRSTGSFPTKHSNCLLCVKREIFPNCH